MPRLDRDNVFVLLFVLLVIAAAAYGFSDCGSTDAPLHTGGDHSIPL